jgi:hypothetical protein
MIKIIPVILILIQFLICAELFSQSTITIDSINTEMEVLQGENNYGRMISLGESYLRKGYDSFFLRARLGIAYYETNQYLKAIPQLENTMKYGIDNPSVLTDLYFSYFYTGREADRDYVFSRLNKSSKKRLQPLNNIIANNIFSDFGFSVSGDEADNSMNTVPGELYNEQIVNGNAFFIGVGINQLLFQSLSIDYVYNYLKIDKTKIIKSADLQYSNDYSEYQNRFYNRYNIRVSDGLVISPAGHFIGIDYSSIFGQSDTANSASGYSVYEKGSVYDSFVLSADITKYKTKYRAGINGSFSFLNNIHQWQLGASFKIFPMNKASFYTASDIYIQNQNDVANLIFNQSLGGFSGKKFFYELFFTIGNINNFNERNGALVYNDPDVIKFKTGFDMKYYITHLFNLNLGYSFQSRDRNSYAYVNDSSVNSNQLTAQKSSLISYSINNIFAGFKFTF